MGDKNMLKSNKQLQQKKGFWTKFVWNHLSWTLWKLIGILTLVLLLLWSFYIFNRKNSFSISNDEHISLTATQIRSIKDIGQWEFLSISDEELVDTVRKGFFGDDELIRIYYGTLRLGVDLHELKENWIDEEKDSTICTLPPIKLLEEHFIDEAQTRSFFEKGTWATADREALYNRAYQTMRERCLTIKNIERAKKNAQDQFRNLLQSMGLKNIKIQFTSTNTKK
jgi:hypothetical protein